MLLQKEHADPMRWICTLLWLVFAFGSGLQADDSAWELSTKWVERGPVKAQVQLRHDKMSILQQQELHVTLRYPEGMDIQLPGFLERLEDYRPVPWRDDIKTVDSGNVVLEKFLRFELFESGEQVLPPFRVEFSTGFGENRITRSLDTPDLTFHIQGIDNPALVNAPLEDNVNIIRPQPYPWGKAVGIGLGILSILGALIGLWVRYRKHKIQPLPPPEPAHEWAWRALEMLVNEQESGTLSNENFVDRLSLILRTYIEKRFAIHAPEQTTEEFLAEGVKLRPQLAEHQLVLMRFMEYADLIKFAKKSAGSEDVQKGFDFIKSFVENTQEVSV